MSARISYDSVVVTTRIRLARNFADYPFPNRLKNVVQAREIVRLIAAELKHTDTFDQYDMNNIPPERAAFLKERNLISRDLIENRRISAAFISRDESISVMVNEEDHVREQYFLREYNLEKVYERISGIDDIISESIPFAYDKELGYLTACPTNLGTGLRASVMLFLPALSRKDLMREIMPSLYELGLTVRGSYGEGSGAEGELFQISNELTLGLSEEEILRSVKDAVEKIVEFELREREQMLLDDERGLRDKVLRSYGILTNCATMEEGEFMQRMADVKLGVATKILHGNMSDLDNLVVAMRPANINRLNGAPLGEGDRNAYRAEYAGKALRSMKLFTWR
ncbi:MAG: ATP--guanido phosphotransferase [Clostridia bacterium]|jgi:protein arginine kinase|nr:ATP--guanido phosphotransferase [Clostridia bacterium]